MTEVYGVEPYDIWTFAHGFVGFLFGKSKVSRLIAYSIAIGFEVLQIYFYYPEHGLELKDVWLNSIIDILAFIACYEIALI